MPFCDEHSSLSTTTENQLDGSARHLELEEEGGREGGCGSRLWLEWIHHLGLDVHWPQHRLNTDNYWRSWQHSALPLQREDGPHQWFEWHAFDRLTVPEANSRMLSSELRGVVG